MLGGMGMRCAALLAALASICALAAGATAAGAHGVRPPVLGDWEGTGPEGLPLSFVLARRHGRVSVSDLTVGDPLRCPGRIAPTDAYSYPQSVYIGPGALPVVRINWRPDSLEIRVGMGAPFGPELDGRLVNARRAILSEPAPAHLPAGCSWNTRRLTWRLAPARRLSVTAGEWTGTISAAGVTGTVSFRVGASGRVLELFNASAQCEAGGGSFGIGQAPVGDFIMANGSFSDPSRPAPYQGRFTSPGAVAGTVSAATLGCGEGALAFTAHPG